MGRFLCASSGFVLSMILGMTTPVLNGLAFGAQVNANASAALQRNPAGLGLQGEVSIAPTLYTSSNPLLGLNFVKSFLRAAISPAAAQGGFGLTIQPISVLGFSASAQRIAYFGTYGHLQTSQAANFDWSDTAIEKRYKEAQKGNKETPADFSPGDSKVTSGSRIFGNIFSGSTYVQAKYAYFLSKTEVGYMRFNFGLAKNDKYFYDPGEDLLVKNGREVLFLKSDFVTQTSTFAGCFKSFQVGVSYRNIKSFVEGKFRANHNHSTSQNERVGPTFLYAIPESDQQKNLALLIQFYLRHPYRSQSPLPYALLAFSWDFSVTSF